MNETAFKWFEVLRRALVYLSFAGVILCSGMAIAAEVRVGGDPEMSCVATLSGNIVRGDNQKIEQALQDYRNNGFFCLDSSGGSWTEGLLIMQTFFDKAVPTAVAAGARCESACAVAFLGGSAATMNPVPVRARFLHVEGVLGFHAPFLDIPQAQYDRETVLVAYDAAMRAVSDLTAWSERLDLPDAFLVNLFGTGRDDMYAIDTVGKAAELSINLVGHTMPQDISEEMAIAACAQNSPIFAGENLRYDEGGKVELVRRFENPASRNAGKLAAVIVRHDVESWSGWYACVVSYHPTKGPVSVPDFSTLLRFDGLQGHLLAQIADAPFQEWQNPMIAHPPLVQETAIGAARTLSRIIYDNNVVHSTRALPQDLGFADIMDANWSKTKPALLYGAANPTTGAAAGGNTTSIKDQCVIVVASRASQIEAQKYVKDQGTSSVPLEAILASNGWYAIIAGLVFKSEAQERLVGLKARGLVPKDAYCSETGRFAGISKK